MAKESKKGGLTLSDVSSKTFRLVLSAIMIALATVLSIIKIPFPLGGSITLAAMVPLVIVSQLYGTRWGLFTCSVYGVLQLFLGLSNFSYVTGIAAYLMVIFFDYVIAYGAVGLSGLTKNMKNRAAGAALGAFIGCLVRFLLHCISGALVWGMWADITALPDWVQAPAGAIVETNEDLLIYSYSFFYNLSYMLPETVITMLGAAVIIGVVDKITSKKA